METIKKIDLLEIKKTSLSKWKIHLMDLRADCLRKHQ